MLQYLGLCILSSVKLSIYVDKAMIFLTSSVPLLQEASNGRRTSIGPVYQQTKKWNGILSHPSQTFCQEGWFQCAKISSLLHVFLFAWNIYPTLMINSILVIHSWCFVHEINEHFTFDNLISIAYVFLNYYIIILLYYVLFYLWWSSLNDWCTMHITS